MGFGLAKSQAGMGEHGHSGSGLQAAAAWFEATQGCSTGGARSSEQWREDEHPWEQEDEPERVLSGSGAVREQGPGRRLHRQTPGSAAWLGRCHDADRAAWRA